MHAYIGHRAEDPKEGEERQQLYAKTRAEAFGKEVKKRILLGTFALSAEYVHFPSHSTVPPPFLGHRWHKGEVCKEERL
jgi:Asp-tRNA(Asn)/Glu-tRNA(Gln) amidotransferase A subunit family amidase